MRLKNYLKEDENIINILENDCSEILNIYKKTNKILYRGTKRKTSDILKLYPHKNRNPRDINQFLTKYIDNYLNNKFGWKPRTEGVFATFNDEFSQEYGNTYLFFPKDGFKYIWSPKVDDLLNTLDDLYLYPNTKYNSWKELYNIEKIKDYLDIDEYIENVEDSLNELLRSYISKNMERSFKSGDEIIFKCEYYYIVNDIYENDIIDIL